MRTPSSTAGIASVTSIFAVAAVIAATPAWAHVHVSSDHTTPGDDAVLTFEVPNESDKGALTTELTVALPNLTEVSTEQAPGWTAKLDRDVAAGTVRSVTWTAKPGAGIAPDQFALFRVAVQLPQTGTISFPATQTYADGTVVRWDQPTPAGGAEPEHPEPTLTLTGQPATSDQHDTMGATPTAPPVTAQATPPAAAAADDTARWLGGAALVIAAAAAAFTFLRRQRS